MEVTKENYVDLILSDQIKPEEWVGIIDRSLVQYEEIQISYCGTFKYEKVYHKGKDEISTELKLKEMYKAHFRTALDKLYEKTSSYQLDAMAKWDLFCEELVPTAHKILCKQNKPQNWVEEFVGGDIRDTIVALVTCFVSQYSLQLGIAVPLVSFIIKKGLFKFCENPNYQEPQNEL